MDNKNGIMDFIHTNYGMSTQGYITSLSKKGIIEDLSKFGVTVVSSISFDSLRKIYTIVLNESMEKRFLNG